MQSDCIGIDIGYGFTKTCSGAERQIFPTAITLMAGEPRFQTSNRLSSTAAGSSWEKRPNGKAPPSTPATPIS